jgi:outer membrane protein TolC
MFCVSAQWTQAQIFKSAITFKDAASLAVSASRDLQNEKAGQAIKQNSWTLGRRAYLPKLTLQAAEDDRLSVYDSDTFSKNFSVNVDQLLFDGGRLIFSRRLERARLELSASGIESLSGDIAESAVSAYRDILIARETLAIRKRGREALAVQRRILQKEVELGLALHSDLDEADITLAEALVEIMSLETETAEMTSQFLDVIGLDTLPELIEKIDVSRKAVLPDVQKAASLALERNQELKTAALSVKQKKEEARFAALSWIPSLRATGSFSTGGSRYPLTKYSWQAGLSIEFASPYINLNSGANYGYSGRNDRTARLSGSAAPLPDPASSLTARQAKSALVYEREKYEDAFRRLPRRVELAADKCLFAENKRLLAAEMVRLARNKLEVLKVKHHLGHITSIELIEAQTSVTEKEIALVQAASAVMAAERGMERLLDLQPGELRNL